MNRCARLGLCVLLAPLAASSACHAYSAPGREAGAGKCTAQAPADMQAGAVKWFGGCAAGRATGLGVLRVYTAAGPGDAFYGEVAAGAPLVGVIETKGGYVFGRFRAGAVLPSSEPQTAVDAFRAASNAALAASRKFRREGNAASADFYARKAKQLNEALD